MSKNQLASVWCSNYLFQFFFCFGLFMPFYQLWLKHHEMSSKDIGIILAAGLISRCLASFMGSLIKHEASYQTALRALGALSFLTAIAMSFYAVDFTSIVVITCLFNIAIAPIFGLSDAIITALDKRKTVTYGSVRMWGSIGFVAATITGGYVFEVWSASALPLLLIILCGVLFTSALFRCPQLRTQHEQAQHHHHDRQPVSDRRYSSTIILLLITVVLLQSSHAFFYGFASVYWQEIGLSQSTIGYLWGVSMGSEILIFFLAKKLFSNVSPMKLLQLASLCVMVRWTALAVLQDPFMIATAQWWNICSDTGCHD